MDNKKYPSSKDSHSEMKDVYMSYVFSPKDGFPKYDLMRKFVDFVELEKENTAKDAKILKDIQKLSDRYSADFFAVSREFETWASRRRQSLKQIEDANSLLTKLKTYTSKGKIVLSTIDVIGTCTSLVLERFVEDWAHTLLYTSAGFGCLSFIVSMIDITKTSFLMEEILDGMRKDAELLERVQNMMQRMNGFDRDVQKLFPHGIDPRVVKLIQEPYTARKSRPEDYKGVMNALSKINEKVQIFLAVLISNLRRDPALLEDKEFMANAQAFAKTSIAEKWWNRMKYRGMLPICHKSKFFTYLNSLSRLESMPIRTFPLLSSPIWHLNGFPTVGAIFMNSLVVFDAYCDLIEDGKGRETDLLQELKLSLATEYKQIVDMYQKLTPYNDE